MCIYILKPLREEIDSGICDPLGVVVVANTKCVTETFPLGRNSAFPLADKSLSTNYMRGIEWEPEARTMD